MSHDDHAELAAMVTGWFAEADSGVASLYPGHDKRRCAEQLETWLSRHAPTDPAPPDHEETTT